MEGIIRILKGNRPMAFLNIAVLLLSFHYFLTVYINSSFLSTFLNQKEVGLMYTAASFATLVAFIIYPWITRRIGNFWCIALFSLLELAAVVGLAMASTPRVLIALFIAHQTIPPLLSLALDVILEKISKQETLTGSIRGIFLTASNIALVLSPLLAGFLISRGNFNEVYFLSSLMILPFIFIMFVSFKDNTTETSSTHPARVALLFSDPDIRSVVIANFLLQFFYAWMVIYTPLYLNQYVGFSWESIGLIFTVMLLPFLLFELPLGRLADKKTGEKEFMLIGFALMAASTYLLTSHTSPSLFWWMAVLFLTRTGAAFVEVTTESYFFKQVDARASGLISVFRSTRPLAYLVGATAGAGILSLGSFNSLFFTLSLLMASGMLVSFMMNDTK